MFKIFSLEFRPLTENATLTDKVKYHVKLTYFRFILFTFVLGIISMLANFWVNFESDFVLAVGCFVDAISIFTVCLQLAVAFNKRKEIWELLQELKEMFDRRIEDNKKYEVKKYLDEYYRMVKYYGFANLATLLPVIFPIIPFMVAGTMKLDVQYWFPFDPYKGENFFFAWAWSYWVAQHCIFLLYASDSLIYALITTLTLEFDVLKADFEEIKSIAEGEMKSKIKKLVDRHNELLDIGVKLQNIYGLSFFCGFTATSLILCLVAFQLSNSDNELSVVVLYIGYFGVFSSRQLLLCWHGQMLIDSSVAVADGVYCCKWEEIKNDEIKKLLIMTTQRAQTPVALTALQFAVISLQTFTRVSNLCDLFVHQFI